MICSNPYVKAPPGTWDLNTKEGRLTATPFPCGKCMSCRTHKARILKTRITLEGRTSENSWFITLTYNDENVPDWYTLDKNHIETFIRRVRRSLEPRKVRYFYVAEYGDRGRPHYHICLFGIGTEVFDKDIVETAWTNDEGQPFGFTHIGSVTPESAGYVAGYVTKGLTKYDLRGRDYTKYLGYGKCPEFTGMSRKPGLGYDGIVHIARSLEKSKWYKPDKVIREIPIGKRKMPIGRYLESTLSRELNIPEAVKEAEFWNYQQELLDEFWDKKKGVNYRKNIIDAGDGKRRAIKARARFFKKIRRLDND